MTVQLTEWLMTGWLSAWLIDRLRAYWVLHLLKYFMTDSTVWKPTNTLNDLQMYMYLLLIDWIGTFSNDDDDGSENVAKKMNLRFGPAKYVQCRRLFQELNC